MAGTPIHTDKGLVPIERIKVGDKVLSYNEKTKQFEYKQVAHTFIGTKENLVHIKIKGEKRLTTTTEHPFYIKKTHKARDSLSSGDDDDEEGEWVEAGELKVGDRVLRPNGKWTRITRIEYETREITVYNFEVEGNHSYFVGDVGVLSHNCNPVKVTAESLGIVGNITKFDVTFRVEGGKAIYYFKDIAGEIKNPFSIVSNMIENARASGASTLRVEGFVVNAELREALAKRYGLEFGDKLLHSFEIPLR